VLETWAESRQPYGLVRSRRIESAGSKAQDRKRRARFTWKLNVALGASVNHDPLGLRAQSAGRR